MACVDLTGFSPSDYFRTGLYTHLWLPEPTLESSGDTLVKWTYTYRDFGMDHTIDRRFLVRPAEGQGYWVRPAHHQPLREITDVCEGIGQFSAQWERVEGKPALLRALFDHYTAFNEELYRDFGVLL